MKADEYFSSVLLNSYEKIEILFDTKKKIT